MVNASFLSLYAVVFFGGIQFPALPKSVAATRAANSGGLRPRAQRKALSPELAQSSDQQPGVREENIVGGQESRIETQAKFASQLPSEFPQCPYVIATEEEALSRSVDTSIPGNVLLVQEIRFGRLGNLLAALSNDFQVAYCCKSKVVTLPPKSDEMAPGVFNEGTPGPRFFDFSGAPDVDGFNASTCPASLDWFGRDSLYLTGLNDEGHPNYTPGLQRCMNTIPRPFGCEAAYWFPVDIDVCSSIETKKGDGGVFKKSETSVDVDFHGRREDAGGGNLVLHVRSGDAFVSPVHHGYGQPPLEYYLRVMEQHQWDRVDVVTNGAEVVNPVITSLESMVAAGEFPTNIHFHKNRSMEEDLASMLCADALATAKSSLARFLAFHSSATRIYFPFTCGSLGGFKDLEAQRPGTKVYGISFDEANYSPYHFWNNTAEELAQMVSFDVGGVEECIGSSGSKI